MGTIPKSLKAIIGSNIKWCRIRWAEHNGLELRGSGKRCAGRFGVTPQQWSPWERGNRTPDEMRMKQLADFFGVTVEWLRYPHRDNPCLPEHLKPAPVDPVPPHNSNQPRHCPITPGAPAVRPRVLNLHILRSLPESYLQSLGDVLDPLLASDLTVDQARAVANFLLMTLRSHFSDRPSFYIMET